MLQIFGENEEKTEHYLHLSLSLSLYIYIYKTREVNKLALPGFRHSVDWWGLPTRLEWALAPDRGAGVT